MSYPKIAQLKTVAALRERLAVLGLELPVDDEILTAAAGSPLAEPISVGGFHVGNRWCIHPMEGWDANRDGSPSADTLRRWRRFGESGAKWIWGGEAAAVRPDRARAGELSRLGYGPPGLSFPAPGRPLTPRPGPGHIAQRFGARPAGFRPRSRAASTGGRQLHLKRYGQASAGWFR